MIVEQAPAKLNLALHVRHRRSDGYHELETLFAFVADGDEVAVAEASEPAFSVDGPFAAALAGEGDNLVLRAERAFRDAFGVAAAHRLRLTKRLPVASGIGGGSADAAATLRALARLHGVATDDPRLFALAEALGADVPACLMGRTAVGRGKGERLEPIQGLAGAPVVLVNPGVAVSTAEVFRRWDGVDRGPMGAGSLIERARGGRNDLEAPARAVAPVIGTMLTALGEQSGMVLARMSGSGATCFALFGDEDGARNTAAAISAAHPTWWVLATHLL